ncbi:MAG: GH3 auxin-responsive promoter family protein [Chitinophagaceae bacterium]|nr:GH3 auxin-responsive promoter family protein [Chitinophagaceae bacterium]
MALKDIKIPKSLRRILDIKGNSSPWHQQRKVLKKLLNKARFTQFGQEYFFDEILMSRYPEKVFQKYVPVYNYEKIYSEWWVHAREGKPDVCWPGTIKFFALSSGTSESSSKYIPITKDIIKANTNTSLRQLFSLVGYNNVPKQYVGKSWLMLGGSTELQKGPTYFAGDLSGIQAKNIPFWFQGLYKPGRKIAKEKDWGKKLEEIVGQAPNWDISFIVGVPAWVQLCMEKIIERYKLKNIHEVWPNLSFYVHGGVALEPYKSGFNKLLGKPITYIETYLASEGFLAYQSRQDAQGMKLVLNNNIFFEFVPFDSNNFDTQGNIVDNPETLLIHQVKERCDYAILISTNAGCWRYLIGDTIQFVDLEKHEIIITGRTKHFLSLVGEHLSVDNMNRAIKMVCEELDISIGEFTVTGEPYGNFFAHHWYIATQDNVSAETLGVLIDNNLKELNDDYAVERKHALQKVIVDVIKEDIFLEFMKLKGKVGGQHKFPRVMKGTVLDEWLAFLKTEMSSK